MKIVFSFRIWQRIICLVLSVALFVSPEFSYAQSLFVSQLPEPGMMVSTSSSFTPVLVKGLVIHPDKPLNFDFIVDSGNAVGTLHATSLRNDMVNVETQNFASLQQETLKMAKYFLAAITVPEDQLWVNLSPYEKDRMIENDLGQTVLGRDMLAQDYLLKQLTASLIYPEKGLGKEFWSKVYEQAQVKFGTTDIPVDTFNKVWIMPEKAEVYERRGGSVTRPEPMAVYVTQARLKVMLDTDYLAANQMSVGALHATPLQSDSSSELAKDILRQVILPALEKEVNEGQNFTSLRQIYHSLILAKWYRQKIVEGIQASPLHAYIGKNKIGGVDVADKNEKERIYQRYIAAYKKGVFNYIKDDGGVVGADPRVRPEPGATTQVADRMPYQSTPRQYFSGGEQMTNIPLTISQSVMQPDAAQYDVTLDLTPLIDNAATSDEQAQKIGVAAQDVFSSSWRIWPYSNGGSGEEVVIKEFHPFQNSAFSSEINSFFGEGVLGSEDERIEKASALKDAVENFRASSIGKMMEEMNASIRIQRNIFSRQERRAVLAKIEEGSNGPILVLEESALGNGLKDSIEGSNDYHEGSVLLLESQLFSLGLSYILKKQPGFNLKQPTSLNAFVLLKELEFIHYHPGRDHLIKLLEDDRTNRISNPMITTIKNYKETRLRKIVTDLDVTVNEIDVINRHLDDLYQTQLRRDEEMNDIATMLLQLGDFFFGKKDYHLALHQYSHGLFYKPNDAGFPFREKVLDVVYNSVISISREDVADFKTIWKEPSSKVSEMWDKIRKITLIDELKYLPESRRDDGIIATRLDQVNEAITFLNYLDSIAVAYNPSIEDEDFIKYLNNKRLAGTPSLKESTIQRFIETYRSLAKDASDAKNNSTKKVLRLAVILQQYSRILHGDESLDAWDIIPTFLKKLGLDVPEREQVMALVSLHRNFGTLYFGEGSPAFTEVSLGAIKPKLDAKTREIPGGDDKEEVEQKEVKVNLSDDLRQSLLNALDAKDVYGVMNGMRYVDGKFTQEADLFKLMPFMWFLNDPQKYSKGPVSILEHTLELIRFLSLIERGDDFGFTEINKGKDGRLITKEIYYSVHHALIKWLNEGSTDAQKKRRRRLLYLVALLHDSGEYKRVGQEMHEVKSAGFIGQILKELNLLGPESGTDPDLFTPEEAKLAQWLAYSHVELGTIRFGERTIHKLYRNDFEGSKAYFETNKASWLKALGLINAADVFAFKKGLNLNQDHFDHFMGIFTDDQYLDKKFGKEGLFERRLKIWCSDGPGEEDRPKLQKVRDSLAAIKQKYPKDHDRIVEYFGDPERYILIDYVIFFMQSLRAEDMVKLMYILSIMTDSLIKEGQDFHTIKFTAPSTIAPFSADPINEIMKHYTYTVIHDLVNKPSADIMKDLKVNGNLKMSFNRETKILVIDNKSLGDMNRYIKIASISAAAWLISKARNVTTDNHIESLAFLHDLTKLPKYRYLENNWDTIRLFLGLFGHGRKAINLEPASRLFDGLSLKETVVLLGFMNGRRQELKAMDINWGQITPANFVKKVGGIDSWKDLLKEIIPDYETTDLTKNSEITQHVRSLIRSVGRLLQDNDLTETLNGVTGEDLLAISDELNSISAENLINFENFLKRINIKNGIWNLRQFSERPTHKLTAFRFLYILSRLEGQYERSLSKESGKGKDIQVLKFSHELNTSSDSEFNVIEGLIDGVRKLTPQFLEEIIQGKTYADAFRAIAHELKLSENGIRIEEHSSDTLFVDLRTNKDELGGIDITNIQFSNKGKAAKMQFNEKAIQDLANTGFIGLIPVIVQVEPVLDLRQLLGAK